MKNSYEIIAGKPWIDHLRSRLWTRIVENAKIDVRVTGFLDILQLPLF
jgi:hypothetical protein